jgi:hypothetical protein
MRINTAAVGFVRGACARGLAHRPSTIDRTVLPSAWQCCILSTAQLSWALLAAPLLRVRLAA